MIDYSMYLKTDDRSNNKGPQTLPLQFIIWAYRLFLDREPEDLAVEKRYARTMRSPGQGSLGQHS